MALQVGSLCLFTPFGYEYNPERSSLPKLALFLGRRRDGNLTITFRRIIMPGTGPVWIRGVWVYEVRA